MELFSKLGKKDDRMSQIQNEIRSLQVRKESVMSVIQNEISNLQNDKTNLLLQLGTKVYENWMNQCEVTDHISEFWPQIQEKEKAMQEQEAKRQQMETKYDEEISLLQKDLSLNSEREFGSNSNLICPKCGAMLEQSDVFCEKCGTKVK